jgi:hypothetical protein
LDNPKSPPSYLRLVSKSMSSMSSPTRSEEWTTQTTEAPERQPSAIIDPGQVILVKAHFPDAPSTIRFSYLAPGSDEPFHDPGSGDIASRIIRDGNLYSFWIDTRGMIGGEGWWHFYCDDPDISKHRSKIGKFIIRDDVPRMLFENTARAQMYQTTIGSRDSGLHLLGADAHDDAPAPKALLVAVGIGLALGLTLAH